MARGSIAKTCPHGTTGTAGKPACRVKHGTWSYMVDAGADPVTGKRVQKRRRGFATRDEAQEAMTAQLARLDAGVWVDDRGITLGGWLQEWLPTQTHLEVKTFAGYQTCCREWIQVLGDVRLRDLRRTHVDQALQDLRTPRPATTSFRGRPVEMRKPSTLDQYRRVLRAALAEAVRRGLIAINHAEGKFVVLARRTRPRLDLWEPDQLAAYLAVADEDQEVGAGLVLAALTGLRRGEVAGARWAELDPQWRTPAKGWAGIEVQWTLVEPGRRAIPGALRSCPACDTEHVGLLWKPRPKSAASTRWVPLVGRARDALARHGDEQAAWRRGVGEGWSDHGLVLTRADGAPVRPSLLSSRHQEIVRRLGLPDITLHKLRHSACSVMLAGGVPIDVVQMILGHSSPEVTRQIYAHLQRGSTAAQMEAVFAIVGTAGDQNVTTSPVAQAIGW